MNTRSLAIEATALRKVFTVTRRRAGLRGGLQSLLRPDRTSFEAVAGIDLEMAMGERIALIGPNGAGKSTTIKMLTGIVHPTSGYLRVLGLEPATQRRQLAGLVGTVFGQRPQLWYHLPAIDTLRLLGTVYGLDRRATQARIDLLSEAFGLADLLDVPVRKLSLGQRMRCEVASSFVHRPRLILLDEPSIGLDVVARRRIREMVVRMSEEEGVGVLVTSHDAGDIEAMCRRVAIVDRGRLVYMDEIAAFKRAHLGRRHIHAHYAAEATFDAHLDGVDRLDSSGAEVVLRVDTDRVAMDRVMAALGRAGELVDLTVSEPSLEEVLHAVFMGMAQSRADTRAETA